MDGNRCQIEQYRCQYSRLQSKQFVWLFFNILYQVNTNDQMLVMYIASVIRSVIALHNLINNKLANKEAEKKEGKKEEVKELKEKKEAPEIKAKWTFV